MKIFYQLLVGTIIVAALVTNSQQAIAQDSGKPAVRSLAFYTLGGGVLGIGVGIAYWMLDPLAPSADLRGSVAQGYGGGVFVGFIFGITQLNKQAVFPYRDPVMVDEFDDISTNLRPKPDPFDYSFLDPPKRKPLEIPIFEMEYTF